MKTTRQYGQSADRALTMWVKLARAFSVFNKRTHEHIRTFGLTQPQFGVLECLGHLGPMTTGDLCKKMLVSGGNMTVVIDNLEKEGLVGRERGDKDRRSVMIQLTPKGKKLFLRIFAKHAGYITTLVSVLTPDEQEQLGRLLKKLGLSLRE
ncbi:MarR family transcriptional regulator [bacterium]|nr:MarR family transcriptional regulator [bacterium]